jgi:T5SS/PEP-CTERM-associated repeat protein
VAYTPGSNSLSFTGQLTVGNLSSGQLSLVTNGYCDALAPPACGSLGAPVYNTLTSGAGVIGNSLGSNGYVSIGGNGEVWNINGNLEVGNAGAGLLTFGGGVAVNVNSGTSCVGCTAGSSGTVMVTGGGSLWSSSGNVYIGGIGGVGTGVVTVGNTATLSSEGNITIGTGSTVTADGGNLDAVNIYDSGTLDPSSAITITGNYIQCGSSGGPDCSGIGTLILDVGPGGYGAIDASGTITLDANSVIDIDFSPGYTPGNYNFFESGLIGGFVNDGATININGLTSPYTTTVSGDSFEISVAPEPGTWVLLLTALIAMAAFAGRRKRSIIPNLVI